VPISPVTTSDIESFLDAVAGKPRTKNNFFTTIGTLFNLAKKTEVSDPPATRH